MNSRFPDHCPSPTDGLSAPAASQLALLPASVHRELHAASRAELTRFWPTDRARALLHSISTRPGSMWLDVVPYAPFLRLDDQAFQDAARVHMGVRTFSSFGNAWKCPCGHTVEDNDVTHALGCNRLSGLVQSRRDEPAEVLREFISRLGFPSIREGRYSRLEPCTANSPQARWDFHCNLRPAPAR
jgi:hypothetical protein